MNPSLTLRGYILATREDFFLGPKMTCYQGSTAMTAEELAVCHAEQAAALMRRALPHTGDFILYDPRDDADGWMMIGSNPHLGHDQDTTQLARIFGAKDESDTQFLSQFQNCHDSGAEDPDWFDQFKVRVRQFALDNSLDTKVLDDA